MARRRRDGQARHGFTLGELAIVMVVIGILALIAIPKYQDAREKAFRATLNSDLKNLATQQELYYRDSLRYSADLDVLEAGVSEGVTVTVNEADHVGWSAIAVHLGLPNDQCGIYQGKADPAGGEPATRSGLVTCTF